MQNTAVQRVPVTPMPLHDMARHHFQRMEGRSLQELLREASFALVADLTGFYGVVDLGAVQITGGARWDQIFPPKPGGK